MEEEMVAATSLDSPMRQTNRKGRLLRRVLEADPSQEYLLYRPSSAGADLPLLVSIHGVSRNFDEHAKLLSAYCEMYGVALLVPHFSEEQYPDFQRLGRQGRGRRADTALHLAVAEAASLMRYNPLWIDKLPRLGLVPRWERRGFMSRERELICLQHLYTSE